MTDEHAPLIAELDLLLEQERAVLLSGDLDELASLAAQKEAAIDALNEVEFGDVVAMQDVGAKLDRNKQLLEHALEGIRSVAQQLAELRQARRAFDTYDRRGRKCRISGARDHSVEKRA